MLELEAEACAKGVIADDSAELRGNSLIAGSGTLFDDEEAEVLGIGFGLGAFLNLWASAMESKSSYSVSEDPCPHQWEQHSQVGEG